MVPKEIPCDNQAVSTNRVNNNSEDSSTIREHLAIWFGEKGMGKEG